MENAIEIEPNNQILYREASLEAVHLKNMKKTLMFSEQALKIEPNNHELLGNYATNLLIDAQDKKAMATIKKALKIEPNDQVNKNVYRLIQDVVSGSRPRPTLDTIFFIPKSE